MQIYFITSNENKRKEAEDILGFEIHKIVLDIKEIQAIDSEEVVKDKARRAYQETKKPVMVDDTGLHIKAWKGFPGALIKWALKTLGNDGLCKILEENDKTAFAKTSICLYNGKELKVFNGEINGKIRKEPKGEGGFGWDPIFQPDGYNKTFAEISQKEKDKISMRKIALVKMKEFLEVNPGFLE